jgi:hypothetical protein
MVALALLAGCSEPGLRTPGVPGRVTLRPDFQEDSRVEIRDSFVRPKRPRVPIGALAPPVVPAPVANEAADDDAPPRVILHEPAPAFPD